MSLSFLLFKDPQTITVYTLSLLSYVHIFQSVTFKFFKNPLLSPFLESPFMDCFLGYTSRSFTTPRPMLVLTFTQFRRYCAAHLWQVCHPMLLINKLHKIISLRSYELGDLLCESKICIQCPNMKRNLVGQTVTI